VPVQAFSATDFRNLTRVEFDPVPGFNLICGPNAAGKTSILEAIAYLGRGRSFRGASATDLVRHGQKAFVLFGRVADGERESRVGVRNGPGGLEIRIDGVAGGGAAGLAEALPLQIIDPYVHDLISGGPEQRRRYLDWIAFHVEHGYLQAWRRFRQVLRQRNAALRSDASEGVLKGWNTEFLAASERIDRGRRLALAAAAPALEDMVGDLCRDAVAFEYAAGWNPGKGLEAVLEEAERRDRLGGATQYGPHRADLRVELAAGRARNIVSRGQEKLLACALVLAATETVQAALERPMTLLVDDPAAELDRDAVARLLRRVETLGSQVIATSLEPDAFAAPAGMALFHVEHGELRVA
jgi:DNA replication and repair protein RecF